MNQTIRFIILLILFAQPSAHCLPGFGDVDDTEDATKAVSIVQQRSIEVLAFFSQEEIEKEDITAYEIDKRAVREMKDYEEINILGYEISRQIEVTLHDLNKYEAFVKKLLNLPNVTNLDTRFDRTDREGIENDLVAKACADAREQARQMTEGFGSHLGPVYAISRSGFQDLSTRFGVGTYGSQFQGMPRLARDDEEILFVPATIELSNSVSAIFTMIPEGK